MRPVTLLTTGPAALGAPIIWLLVVLLIVAPFFWIFMTDRRRLTASSNKKDSAGLKRRRESKRRQLQPPIGLAAAALAAAGERCGKDAVQQLLDSGVTTSTPGNTQVQRTLLSSLLTTCLSNYTAWLQRSRVRGTPAGSQMARAEVAAHTRTQLTRMLVGNSHAAGLLADQLECDNPYEDLSSATQLSESQDENGDTAFTRRLTELERRLNLVPDAAFTVLMDAFHTFVEMSTSGALAENMCLAYNAEARLAAVDSGDHTLMLLDSHLGRTIGITVLCELLRLSPTGFTEMDYLWPVDAKQHLPGSAVVPLEDEVIGESYQFVQASGGRLLAIDFADSERQWHPGNVLHLRLPGQAVDYTGWHRSKFNVNLLVALYWFKTGIMLPGLVHHSNVWAVAPGRTSASGVQQTGSVYLVTTHEDGTPVHSNASDAMNGATVGASVCFWAILGALVHAGLFFPAHIIRDLLMQSTTDSCGTIQGWGGAPRRQGPIDREMMALESWCWAESE